ncbi:MAG: hypothetical protein R3191_03390 [Anaerolineales bacterium]|nr:hypothetical protein [Anaerolineales bacterium]
MAPDPSSQPNSGETAGALAENAQRYRFLLRVWAEGERDDGQYLFQVEYQGEQAGDQFPDPQGPLGYLVYEYGTDVPDSP